jgi:hypothetical protein
MSEEEPYSNPLFSSFGNMMRSVYENLNTPMDYEDPEMLQVNLEESLADMSLHHHEEEEQPAEVNIEVQQQQGAKEAKFQTVTAELELPFPTEQPSSEEPVTMSRSAAQPASKDRLRVTSIPTKTLDPVRDRRLVLDAVEALTRRVTAANQTHLLLLAMQERDDLDRVAQTLHVILNSEAIDGSTDDIPVWAETTDLKGLTSEDAGIDKCTREAVKKLFTGAENHLDMHTGVVLTQPDMQAVEMQPYLMGVRELHANTLARAETLVLTALVELAETKHGRYALPQLVLVAHMMKALSKDTLVNIKSFTDHCVDSLEMIQEMSATPAEVTRPVRTVIYAQQKQPTRLHSLVASALEPVLYARLIDDAPSNNIISI